MNDQNDHPRAAKTVDSSKLQDLDGSLNTLIDNLGQTFECLQMLTSRVLGSRERVDKMPQPGDATATGLVSTLKERILQAQEIAEKIHSEVNELDRL